MRTFLLCLFLLASLPTFAFKRCDSLPLLAPEREGRAFWTKERIVYAIKLLHENGRGVDLQSMRNDTSRISLALLKQAFGKEVTPRSIEAAAYRIIGKSWSEVLRAAGLDPVEIEGRESAGKWQSKDRIVEAIKVLYAAEHALNYSALVRGPQKSGNALLREKGFEGTLSSLGSSALRLFGSWDAALIAAGLDPKEIKLRFTYWSDSLVLRALTEFAQAELPINSTALQKGDSEKARAILKRLTGTALPPSSLFNAASGRFGSLPKAMKAAGIDPRSHRLTHLWQDEEFVPIVKAAQAESLPLNAKAVTDPNGPWGEFLQRKFGIKASGNAFHLAVWKRMGWDNLLRKSGVDPWEVRKKLWARARLSYFPSQKEVVSDSSGETSTQRLVGRSERDPADQAGANEMFAKIKEVSSGLEEKDRELFLGVIDAIFESPNTMSPLEIALELSASRPTPVQEVEVKKVLSKISRELELWIAH